MVTLKDVQEAFAKGRRSGTASAAAKKRTRKRGPRAKSIGLLTLAGAVATGSLYLATPLKTLFSDLGFSSLELARDQFRARATDKGNVAAAIAMLGMPYAGKLILGRQNPGIGAKGRFVIRLF